MQHGNDKNNGRKRPRSGGDIGGGDEDRHRSKTLRRDPSRPSSNAFGHPRDQTAGVEPSTRTSTGHISSDTARHQSSENEGSGLRSGDARETIWQDITDALDALQELEAPAAIIDDMMHLRNIAYNLVEKGCDVRVPHIYPTDSYAAIHRHVSEAVWGMFTTHHFRNQGQLKAKVLTCYGYECAQEFERQCDEVFDLWTRDESNRPESTPVEIFKHVAWQVVTMSFDTLKPSSRTTARFEDLRQSTDHGMTPEFVPRLAFGWGSAEAYCEQLLYDIREDRKLELGNIRFEWDQALSDAQNDQDERECSRLEDGRKTMETVVRAGGAPYGPYNPIPPDWTKRDKWETLARSLGFDQDRSEIQGNWQYKCQLGRGNFGNASLWVRYGPGLRITGRQVIKETYTGLHGAQWNSPRLWFGEYYDRVPLEYALARSAACKPGGDTIVRFDSYGIYDTMAMYRLYGEYCPHGDLETLIDEYVGMQYAGLVDEDGRRYDGRIPSRMLWAIFEALVAALCMMSDGKLPSYRASVPHHPFLHRDLKPANIFLAKPASSIWRGIPVAKVGDFGLAVHSDDPRCEEQGVGSPGYQAPEAYEYPPNSPWYDSTNITAKADMWSVARTMLSLMTLNNDRIESATLDDPVPPRLPQSLWRHYSQDLIDLVHDCLEYDLRDRPSCQEAWHRIKREVDDEGPGLYGLSLKRQEIQEGEIILYRDPTDVYSKLSFQRA
ncbi:hypothetical protein CERZMDRAFT_92879 [Cercospora zeae-maydis SCOH1-5]|uniref:non-specific serine/threonine protein kinase n=1 Tax=Cercospora zeae-maydis SCOH1-5 TaxID=717836 RepID=A0A6A6FTL6_9PEZI|nr:hypothetical protein CERZMDRAFT_92879 [Cercospora zeae-maydis SCOH1-5]